VSALYYDWIANHALRRPESLAAIDLGSGRRFTYAQFHERIGRLASVMRETYGVERGDRVAVFAPNTTETFEVQFAAARLGAIFVPLNWRLAVPELRAILSDCAPVVLIHDAEFADRAEAFTGMRLCAFGGPGSVYEQALAAAAPLAVCERCC
jgi:fatty-acyl-CoA synthase